jgi:hypothetical protein
MVGREEKEGVNLGQLNEPRQISYNAHDIDVGILPYLERMWEAGYTTESSCSGLVRDHSDRSKRDLRLIRPSIIFTNPTLQQSTAIYRAARYSLCIAFMEEWFEVPRMWVICSFRSWWFHALPLRVQELTYSICLKVFTRVLTKVDCKQL